MVPKQLIDEIRNWIKTKKYGNIQINFVNGRVLSWNLHMSIKPESQTSQSANSTTVEVNGRK